MSKKKRANVREFMDQDYINKLFPEERAWLEQFNDEYYHDYFKKDVKPLHDEEQRVKVTDANNALNRDIYAPVRKTMKTEREFHKNTKRNVRNSIASVEQSKSYNMEDALIAYVDKTKVRKGEQ